MPKATKLNATNAPGAVGETTLLTSMIQRSCPRAACEPTTTAAHAAYVVYISQPPYVSRPLRAGETRRHPTGQKASTVRHHSTGFPAAPQAPAIPSSPRPLPFRSPYSLHDKTRFRVTNLAAPRFSMVAAALETAANGTESRPTRIVGSPSQSAPVGAADRGVLSRGILSAYETPANADLRLPTSGHAQPRTPSRPRARDLAHQCH